LEEDQMARFPTGLRMPVVNTGTLYQ